MDLKDLSNNPEQIQQLISILQSLLPQDSNKSTKSKKDKKPANDKAKSNKFLSMPEMRMHKDDTIKFDKKVIKNPPTPRMREYNTVDVTCRSCGKKETISPLLLVDSVDRYKCNTCSTNAG